MKLPKFEEEKQLAEHLKTPHALQTYEKLFLGAQIKKLRKRANMTQADLAKKLKTTQSVVARMEAGKQNFTIGLLITTSHALGKKIVIRFQ